MHFTSEVATDGVLERTFDLDVAGERVPGIIWSPTGTSERSPLVLMGHGGSQHKKFAGIVNRAQICVGFRVCGSGHRCAGSRRAGTVGAGSAIRCRSSEEVRGR